VRESAEAFQEARGTHAEQLPEMDFATFILSLSHSALVHLGDAPAPDGVAVARDLGMARQTIDLLGLLEQKTRGNLTGEEECLLEQVLYDLRMRYVDLSHES